MAKVLSGCRMRNKVRILWLKNRTVESKTGALIWGFKNGPKRQLLKSCSGDVELKTVFYFMMEKQLFA